jgi:hypothetical protein
VWRQSSEAELGGVLFHYVPDHPSVTPSPQCLPARQTDRNTRPADRSAAVVQISTVAFIHSGIGTVRIAELTSEIEHRVVAYQDLIQRLATIPGIDHISAWTVLAEIGIDMNVFGDAAHFGKLGRAASGQPRKRR